MITCNCYNYNLPAVPRQCEGLHLSGEQGQDVVDGDGVRGGQSDSCDGLGQGSPLPTGQVVTVAGNDKESSKKLSTTGEIEMCGFSFLD